MLAQEFLRQDLVDELVLSVMPVMLGGGLRLFDRELPERHLHLQDAVAYRDGMVELT